MRVVPRAGLARAAVPVDAGTAAVLRTLCDVRADVEAMRTAADAARGRTGERTLPRHEVLRHVQVLLDAVIALVEQGPDQEEHAARAEVLAADLAAQGVPLRALLTAVQAARSVVLDRLIGRLRDLLAPEESVRALAALDAVVAPVMTRIVVAHQKAERGLARTSSAARVRALRRLVGSGELSAAEELGLDTRRRYHYLVADVSTPREAASVDALLRTSDGVSGLVNGMLCRVSSQLPTAAGKAAVLVVSAPPVGVADLPATHLLCRQGVEVGRSRGHTGLRPIGSYALDLAVRSQPLLARFLTEDLLGRLDPADPFHRQLAVTGHTYLCHRSRLDVTAAALHVHPNTVANRLRRLATLTGFAYPDESGEDLPSSARWWWALEAWLAQAEATR
ncbi:MAG TPA: helix-turn-helix domain-containing protein [Kineosporiaceae bacterium]|nr:helix-turn-helix domain-containing protein [Kineosporiaceae bacterium]